MTIVKEMVLTGHIGYLGIIPTMLSPHDDRPMIDQLHEGYAHGGGWQPFDWFDVQKRGETWVIQYPGDPPYIERARITMNGETLVVFDYSWVLVIDKHGVQHIARMD
jgi:hypothetical protein